MSDEYADTAALLTSRLGEDDVPIPGIGKVRVRALSRDEAKLIRKVNEDEREAHIIAMGLVKPSMSVSQVKEWMASAPAGELEPVADRIGGLSGLLESSGKDAYKSVRGRSRS